jgi:putative zinc finger/helix-turn-helix YgiT family protein
MICFKCSGEEFATQTAVIRQDFRGEQLDVNTPVSVCQACGWQTLARGQADELRKRTADAFRQKHGLLTSAEIVSRRKSLAMSQREFADFLRVGEASVKRWETWQVQDDSSDELIRMKCDFGTQLQQQALDAALKHFLTSQLVTSCRVMTLPATGFFMPQGLARGGDRAGDFSILGCQQNSRNYPTREWFKEEPDAKYDTNTDLAAAA